MKSDSRKTNKSLVYIKKDSNVSIQSEEISFSYPDEGKHTTMVNIFIHDSLLVEQTLSSSGKSIQSKMHHKDNVIIVYEDMPEQTRQEIVFLALKLAAIPKSSMISMNSFNRVLGF